MTPPLPIPPMIFRKMANTYLKEHGLTRWGGWQLLLRALLLFFIMAHIYAFYLMYATSLWVSIPVGMLLGASLAGVGMMVMHDASHCTFNKNKHLNTFFYILSTHLAGISRVIWTRQHVVAHHGHTNVLGKDKDLDASGFLRLHPCLPHRFIHHIQPYLYPMAYALVIAKWIWVSDMLDIATNTYRMSPTQRIKGIIDILTTRIVHITLFLLVPMAYLGTAPAVGGYIALIFTASAILVFVFQPAHVTPLQRFYTTKTIKPLGYEAHQIQTSANFGIGHLFLTLYTGALNHQIEHHLFPHIAHIHYSKLAPMVRRLCIEYDLPYHTFRSFPIALRAHHKHMVALAQPTIR